MPKVQPEAAMAPLTSQDPRPHSATACTDHTWCKETGQHQLHRSAAVRVSVGCGTPASNHQHGQDPYLDARIIDLGDGPLIGFADCDLTADGLRAETRKILAAVPQLLALADTLDRSTAGEQVTA